MSDFFFCILRRCWFGGIVKVQLFTFENKMVCQGQCSPVQLFQMKSDLIKSVEIKLTLKRIQIPWFSLM